ncbi:MAG: NAD(P)-dependent alcohol dehydrogenase [Prolixibacteraceae bacterium]|nr:NAD(P)-dependent alcohol dehydrogenase [Prolixibacteraceae bacterium]
MKTQTMKAVLCTKYGAPEVLKLGTVNKPNPKLNEVCIKIYASAVTNSDIFIRSSRVPLKLLIPFRLAMGITKPRRPILGLVLAGEIVEIGMNVTKYNVGDKVYGLTGFGIGCYAEYKCMKTDDSTFGCLSKMPSNVTFEEATMLAYGGLLALQYLEKGDYKSKKQIAIYGASGTTGTLAVQLAKQAGAHVTAICSERNHELVKSLGADEVLDYTKQEKLPEGKQFDLVLDAVGKMKTSVLRRACEKALTSDGENVSIDDGDLKLVSSRLKEIKELTEAGLIKPYLDKIYSLDEIVEAHRYVQQGHKRGGVAIRIG